MNKNFSREEYRELYIKLLTLHKESGMVHAGGSISILPVLYILFSGIFDANQDLLIFSKGHTVSALYCVLALRGYISDSDIKSCCQDGARLGGHPPVDLVEFAPFGTGSLGHGLSLAAGCALAKKLMNQSGRIFCICGDGEFQEGACWEALNFAVAHKLENLSLVIDCNNWQGFDSVKKVIGYELEGLESRLSAFGADVKKCDVHDFDLLFENLTRINNEVPYVLLVNSIKGEGMGIYQNTLESHYVRVDEKIYQEALQCAKVL